MRHGAAGRRRRAGRVGATWTPRGYDTACAQRYGHVAHPPLTGRRRSDSGPPPACARTDKSADTLWATGAGLSAVGGRSYPSGRGGLQEPCRAGLGSELYQLVCNVNTNGQYGNKHRGVCVRVRVNTRGSISYPALGRRHPGSDEHAAALTAVSTHRSPTGGARLLGERSARGWGTGNTGEAARSRHRARSERRPHGHSCTSLGKNTQGGRGGLKPT